MLVRMWRNRKPHALWVEKYNGTDIEYIEYSALRWFLKKLKVELLYDATIPLPGIHPQELKAGTQRDMCTLIFMEALSMIAKRGK